MAVADFNRDGHLDIVTVENQTYYGGTVDAALMLGNGDGTFHPGGNMASMGTIVDDLSAVAVGDFNHDGKLDIAVTDSSQNLLGIYLGDGQGNMAVPVSYPVGLQPAALVIAEVNNDGIPDVITANKGSGTLSVLFGNGDGTFRSATSVAAGGADPVS